MVKIRIPEERITVHDYMRPDRINKHKRNLSWTLRRLLKFGGLGRDNPWIMRRGEDQCRL